MRVQASVVIAPADATAALLAAAENLAATDETPGAIRLWSEEEGEALATLLTAALASLPLLPDQDGDAIRDYWMRYCKVKSCTAGAPFAAVAALNILAFSFGGRWKRGCSQLT